MSDESEPTLTNSRLNVIKYNVHTPFQDKPKERLAEMAKAFALPVHMLLLNLDGNMNIAMTIRTAAVMGISDVWIVGRRKYDARPEVGSKNYVAVHKIDRIEDPKAFFQAMGLQPVLVEQGGKALEEFSFKPMLKNPAHPICLVLGSESHGIPADWLKAMGETPRVSISQYGMVRSLNVSIAGSIVLYEVLKQWRQLRLDGL